MIRIWLDFLDGIHSLSVFIKPVVSCPASVTGVFWNKLVRMVSGSLLKGSKVLSEGLMLVWNKLEGKMACYWFMMTGSCWETLKEF
jgi:hypothetical protein